MLVCASLEQPSEIGGIISFLLFRTLKLSEELSTEDLQLQLASLFAMGMPTCTLSPIRKSPFRIFNHSTLPKVSTAPLGSRKEVPDHSPPCPSSPLPTSPGCEA